MQEESFFKSDGGVFRPNSLNHVCGYGSDKEPETERDVKFDKMCIKLGPSIMVFRINKTPKTFFSCVVTFHTASPCLCRTSKNCSGDSTRGCGTQFF